MIIFAGANWCRLFAISSQLRETCKGPADPGFIILGKNGSGNHSFPKREEITTCSMEFDITRTTCG